LEPEIWAFFSKSFLKYELIKPEHLHLIIRSQEKISKIAEEFPKSTVSTFDEVNELDADLIIIAVKPQDFQTVAQNIRFTLKENQMILSIMAGINIEKIQNLLNIHWW
jgi:pyrroline-5-carboxylate reductase